MMERAYFLWHQLQADDRQVGLGRIAASEKAPPILFANESGVKWVTVVRGDNVTEC